MEQSNLLVCFFSLIFSKKCYKIDWSVVNGREGKRNEGGSFPEKNKARYRYFTFLYSGQISPISAVINLLNYVRAQALLWTDPKIKMGRSNEKTF